MCFGLVWWVRSGASPSLRGSGLKCEFGFKVPIVIESPSLRGSGLKFFCPSFGQFLFESPSLRGSGLK